MTETLDALVRRADPDRWLAARFAGKRREDLAALYALNHELARVAETVSTPMLGEIRLAWWRERLEAMSGGHPVIEALAATPGVDRAALAAMVDARLPELDAEPFVDEDALVAYIDATAGSLMAAAARLLDPAAERAMVQGAARAWGWAGLMRAGPAWTARGRRWTPLAWDEADDAEIAAHVAHRVEAALDEAQDELKALPVAAFPAVAYATLARQYAAGGRPADLEKRARLTMAVMRGRV
jgi:phytoene synthase